MSNYRDKVASWSSIDLEDSTWEKTALDAQEAGGLFMSRPMAAGGYLAASKAIDVADPAVGTIGYNLNKMLHGGLGGLLKRVRADEVFADSVVKGMAERTMNLAADAVTKTMATAKNKAVDSPMRQAILTQLKREDDIIAAAPKKDLLEAYHTMKNFAPTLSTDKSAVKSFLRQAAQHGGGIDYMSIKGLADAEAAVTGSRWKR